jgi:uncharacterized membrane protein
MKSRLIRRFVAGLLLFIPLFVLAFGLFKFHELAGLLAEPFLGIADPDSSIGAVLIKLAALVLVLMAIYILGFLADLPVIHTRVQRLDRALNAIIPGYVIAKGIIGGVVKEDQMMDGFRPVLVQCTDGHRLGFEVERTESGLVVVFLPDSPTPRSGVSMVFEPEQVARLNLPPHKAVELLSFYGRGLGQEIEKAMSNGVETTGTVAAREVPEVTANDS